MRRSVEDVPATAHYDFLYGAFRLSKWKIPYFATTITFEHAANDLHLTAEIPGAEDIEWRVEELYQRDLNWPRVEREIVPYLRNTDVPQFFNSLTIALLPYDPHTNELLSDYSEDRAWTPPPLAEPDRFQKQLNVGPISFGFWEAWESPHDNGFASGQLRWNTHQIFGVAIDGQHRLAAIKAYQAAKPSPILDTRVPVLLLLFDPRVGFDAPHRKPIVELLRALFIDLNKHAQVVNRARQILLDDRDPHAVSVRALVGSQLSDHLDELQESPPRLPLALVDWHTEQAKFDDGPYLTTVLGLDWIVSQILQTKPIRDYTDYGAVRRQLNRIQKQLNLDLTTATDRLEDVQNIRLTPFVYSDEDLDAISQAFSNVWATALCHILTDFIPYRNLLDHRIHDQTLSLEFQYWYQLYKRQESDQYEGRATQEYRQFLRRMAMRPDDPIPEGSFASRKEDLEALKAGNLAFTVVFQRALIDAFLEYVKIDYSAIDELLELREQEADDDFPDFGEDDLSAEILEEDLEDQPSTPPATAPPISPPGATLQERVTNRAEEFVRFVNRLVSHYPEFLELGTTFESDDGQSRQFWLGTLLRPEGGIDFTQGAGSRAKDLIFTAAAMCLYDSIQEPNQPSDFDSFWSECLAGQGPSLSNRVGRAIKRFSDRERSAGGRILKAREDDFDEDQSRDEAYHRLSLLWSKLDL